MMLPLSFSGPDSGLHCLESVEYLEPKHCLSSSLGFCFSIISYNVLVVSLRCACHSLLSTKLQLGAHQAFGSCLWLLPCSSFLQKRFLCLTVLGLSCSTWNLSF